MRASRVELAAAAALLVLALSASTTAAEVGPPVPLFPAAPAPAAPVPAPDSAGPAPGSPAPPAASGPDEDDIHAAPLAPVDSSWVGTLGPADGALPHDMWGATPRRVVAAALPLLQPTTSPTLQSLARRLLLSDATAPAGSDAPNGPALPELRLNRLLALGRLDGTVLIDAVPNSNRSERFERDAIELRFAGNDIDGACKQVQQDAGRYSDPWWNRAIIACQALSGGYDQAAIGLSVMRERKIAIDPVFDGLIETIAGQRQKLDKFPDPTPLRMALWAAAQLPLPADVLTSAGPSALAVWATNDKVPAVQRVGAAERAEALGALPPDALGLLYASIGARPEEQQAVLKNAKLFDDPKSRAILYGMARATTTPPSRAAALALLLADAHRRSAFIPMARLVAPLLAELQPTPELQGFAAEAARVLLVAGQFDQAAPWIDLANMPELRLIAALAQSSAASNMPPLADVVAALATRDASAAPAQADLLVAVEAALGTESGNPDLAPLLKAPHAGALPNMALWLDQQQAAAAGRLGETILMSLIMANAGDRLTQEPVILAQVIAGLKAVGFEPEARALAVEASINAGI
jgi:hypothetical protein